MIKCLAIDDEPLALRQLSTYLTKIPFFTLIASCQSALEATDVLNREKVDVLFVDINMPDLNGLDFVRSLQHRPMIVFTTAYGEYALEGYKVDAVDYLLKPFGMADLMRAADKVKHHYDLMHAASLSEKGDDDALFLKTDYRVVRIQPSHIIYVEGMSEYLRIHLTGEDKPLVVLLSMKKLEERLHGKQFMRVHKSYIINLHHIAEIQRGRIVLDEGTDIPVGDSYRDNLATYVAGNFLGK